MIYSEKKKLEKAILPKMVLVALHSLKTTISIKGDTCTSLEKLIRMMGKRYRLTSLQRQSTYIITPSRLLLREQLH